MICHRIGEANLYFGMYLTYKEEPYIIRALNTHYAHTMLLSIEHNMYFETKRIWNEEQQQLNQQKQMLRLV